MSVDEISQTNDDVCQNNKSVLIQFNLARRSKGNDIIKDGLLFRKENRCGRELINLVVPSSRRLFVLKLAYDTCHFAGIIVSGLTWGSSPGLGSVRTDSVKYAAKCPTCQMYARTNCFDRVPIQTRIPLSLDISRWMCLDLSYRMKS